MNAVRYYVALILVILLPPVLYYWLVIHPFVRFWRRLGPGLTYGIVCSIMVLSMVSLFRIGQSLLALEFGTNCYLTVLGLLLLAASTWLGFQILRQMSVLTMLGLPELAPDKRRQQLITTGIYATIRNPRYIQICLGFLGSALIANYLALYLIVALWLPGNYVIVLLEEKELRDRFGAPYDDYCRRVPRFVPKLKIWSRIVSGHQEKMIK